MTDSIEAIEERLKRVLAECTTLPNVSEKSDFDGALVGEGAVLDSVALLQFVLGIETEFSILLDDGSLTPEHFKTLRALATLVHGSLEKQVQ
ncbi:MAG: acyl carrier protein [Rubripirellula sp.]|jgi:acyl carrier protein|nr:acyl carrier protein [Planctomycetaceae bacterium]MDF1844260.1 acyl carrier protein [Rubripirellula sp.]